MDDKIFSSMTPEDLRVARKRLADDLEDYEEMATFHSVHSPAHDTVTQREAQRGKLERMRDKIAEIDRLLSEATTGSV